MCLESKKDQYVVAHRDPSSLFCLTQDKHRSPWRRSPATAQCRLLTTLGLIVLKQRLMIFRGETVRSLGPCWLAIHTHPEVTRQLSSYQQQRLNDCSGARICPSGYGSPCPIILHASALNGAGSGRARWRIVFVNFQGANAKGSSVGL